MFHDRTGLIIWVSDSKQAKGLDKYGHLHYISRKMKYAVLYVDTERYEDTIKNLNRLSYVKRIERSLRKEIKTEYSTQMKLSDKTQSFSY